MKPINGAQKYLCEMKRNLERNLCIHPAFTTLHTSVGFKHRFKCQCEERRSQVPSDNPVYTEALRLLLTVKSWKLIMFSHSFSADASGYSEKGGRLEVKNHEVITVHRLNVDYNNFKFT